MNFFKLPFFNRTYNIASTINGKFFKNISVLTLALLSVCFSLVYIAFIFFIGLNKYVSDTYVNNPDIRNLFISIVHTFAALFAILYASFYIDKKRYDGKIVSPAITTIILFSINLLLGWRCYFLNDLDILVYIATTDGVMLSVFLVFLSILQYDIKSQKTSRRYAATTTARILVISSIAMFLFAIFTYYDLFSYFLTTIAHTNLSMFQTDALVLFVFILAELSLITAIILMYIIEHKINLMLKNFTSRVRNSGRK